MTRRLSTFLLTLVFLFTISAPAYAVQPGEDAAPLPAEISITPSSQFPGVWYLDEKTTEYNFSLIYNTAGHVQYALRYHGSSVVYSRAYNTSAYTEAMGSIENIVRAVRNNAFSAGTSICQMNVIESTKLPANPTVSTAAINPMHSNWILSALMHMGYENSYTNRSLGSYTYSGYSGYVTETLTHNYSDICQYVFKAGTKLVDIASYMGIPLDWASYLFELQLQNGQFIILNDTIGETYDVMLQYHKDVYISGSLEESFYRTVMYYAYVGDIDNAVQFQLLNDQTNAYFNLPAQNLFMLTVNNL